MRDRRTLWQRRAVLAGGLAVAVGWVIGAPRLADLFSSRLTFRDLPGLAPFRVLETSGTVSPGAVLLTGLESVPGTGLDGPPQPDTRQQARIAAVRADPCTALFGAAVDARLPIAFFSDFNCPNCEALNATLENLMAARPDTIRLVRHQLPLLGTASTVASKAVLAADRQGGYAAMHDRLMRSRMVTDLNLVVAMADRVGLDGQRLVADMQLADIADALDRAKAVASVFGFWGTPATVIGRSAFLGQLSEGDVARIIDDELEALPMDCRQPPA